MSASGSNLSLSGMSLGNGSGGGGNGSGGNTPSMAANGGGMGGEAGQQGGGARGAHSLVSGTPIAGNPDWAAFTAPDGRTYYYNATTGVSSWESPQ